MSDGMGREPAYLSSHATNRYFIPNWGILYSRGKGKELKDAEQGYIADTLTHFLWNLFSFPQFFEVKGWERCILDLLMKVNM